MPAGFLLADIATGLLPGDQFTDFAFLPDESVLVVGKLGKVAWAPQSGPARQIATLETNSAGDLGLVGLAVAPDYPSSHTIYTARAVTSTAPGSGANGFLRLSAWTVVIDSSGAPAALTNERIVFQTSADVNVHALTGVVAAADGSLWISIGDAADFRFVDPLALRSLDLADAHGKLLHLRPDGSGAPTNPYYNAANPRAVRSLVYASGFRSPLRFMLDPSTGRPVLGDVGWHTWEEIDVVNPGNNYGWPCWEGAEPTVGYRDLPECAGTTTVNPMWT